MGLNQICDIKVSCITNLYMVQDTPNLVRHADFFFTIGCLLWRPRRPTSHPKPFEVSVCWAHGVVGWQQFLVRLACSVHVKKSCSSDMEVSCAIAFAIGMKYSPRIFWQWRRRHPRPVSINTLHSITRMTFTRHKPRSCALPFKGHRCAPAPIQRIAFQPWSNRGSP